MSQHLHHALAFLAWLVTAPVAGTAWLLRRYVEFWAAMPYLGVSLHLLALALLAVALIVRGEHHTGNHLGPWC